jgi:predicted nucleotidyltransferase
MSSTIIEKVKEKLIETYNPLEIYVFGSYAWGSPDEESDLDLLVIVDNCSQDRYQLLAKGHKALIDSPISKDILIATREEFEKYSQDVTTLYFKIKNKGKLIYAKA